MLVTFYDSYSVLSKIYSEGAFIKQALNGTIIEEKNRKTTTKICYGVLDKDITLSYIIKKLSSKTPKSSIRIVLKISLYSIIYLNTPAHAVINTAVELVKKMGKGGMAGFVNALLRNYVRAPIILPNGSDAFSLSIKYSYPEFAVKKLIDGYGEKTAIDIISYDTENTYVRFNKGVDGENYLKTNGYNYETTPFNNLFSVLGFKMDGGFYEGLYTFQSIGSVAICNGVLASEKGDILEDFSAKRLLDVCSAPGGKTVYLADYFNSVTACELHNHRAELINSYASRMGKTNVTVCVKDATEYDANFVNGYDVVLVDAPCSGMGVIKDNPDIKLNRSEADILGLVKTQLDILNNVSKYVKKGGYLCYSTCSVLRDENDGVISKFLQSNDSYIEVKVKSNLNCVNLPYGNAFLPNISGGAGFYFVKLKKIN